MVSFVPLGGRHVNHFWRLLNGLGIPYITLLDLDFGRPGGGWGRIKYALEQLLELGNDPSSHIFGRDAFHRVQGKDATASSRRSASEVFRDCFGPRLDVQLLINVPEMSADGVDADIELVTDLLISQPFGQAIQHRLFARRKQVLLLTNPVCLLK